MLRRFRLVLFCFLGFVYSLKHARVGGGVFLHFGCEALLLVFLWLDTRLLMLRWVRDDFETHLEN